VNDVASSQPVPLRALTMSFMAMAGAVVAAYYWPDSLIESEVLAGGLALVPALLLAQHRQWPNVSILLAAGLVVLCAVHVSTLYVGSYFTGGFLVLFVVTPYIAIALGAGWFGEVRRYKAELLAAQLQLIQSEKLDSLGRMAAGIAHEVKNPLMVILTGVKILSKRPDTDEQTRALIQDMANAVGRADKIIGGLLSYSRDTGLDLSSADLNAVVCSSLRLVKHDLDRARTTVAVDLDTTIPKLNLDEFKVQQVLVNILNNALHATGEDSEILVRTCLRTLRRGPNVGDRKTDRYRPGERVAVIEVDDSGPGIKDADLKKLFDPFFTTKPTGVGTGLGLSISRQIVDLHGGSIDIGNRDAGGARVTITFKLDDGGART
jgi:signal transduction histidine kinase